MTFLADVIATCRIYNDESWNSLGECRIRLHRDSFSLEVRSPLGPYCLDIAFEKINAEIEMATFGTLLYVRLESQGKESVVEIRGDSSDLDRLMDAILLLVE